MSLDTKYRPIRFDDVLGQRSTIKVLREYLRRGKALRQSYVFGGPFGSGKTTLGRILARALLCSNLTEAGDPCDKCSSCRSLLERGTHVNYVEVDAATNSGKADVQKITDEIQYHTFSGRRRVYTFDECFTEDSELLTPSGPRLIRDLVESRAAEKVWARDLQTGEDGWALIWDWFDHGEREVLELDFGGGLILRVTEDQLFYTSNRGWVEARNLTCADDVVAIESGECQAESQNE